MKYILILTILLPVFLLLPSMQVKAGETDLELQSESAVLIDAETGRVLYEKNSKNSMYPASITKIATAIYAIEQGHTEEEAVVSKEARNTEGTKVFLEEGERVPVKRLIQGMMINSGNDAAVAIAEHVSGSTGRFTEQLNDYLKARAGVEQTNFVNPNGLFSPEHQTTAADMAKITRYALKNEEFAEIFGTKQLKWKGKSWDTTIFTHHKMMKQDPYEGVTGGKNGFVSQAGYTLVTAAERNGLNLIAVTLKSADSSGSYKDTKSLLDFGFSNFEMKKIGPDAALKNSRNGQLQLTKEVSYVTKKLEKTSTEITDTNHLAIKGEDGKVIATAKLTSAEPKSQGLSVPSEREDQPFSPLTFAAPAAALLGVCMTVILIRQARRPSKKW